MSEIVTNKGLLKAKSLTVTPDWFENGKVKELEAELLETMNEQEKKNNRRPLGLSAVQIGKAYQLCVVTTIGKFTKTIINPAILEELGLPHINFETCLSFPGECFMTTRFDKIKIRYLDSKGKVHTKIFRGLLARQLQHEVDHMNGVIPTKEQFKSGNNYVKNRRK